MSKVDTTLGFDLVTAEILVYDKITDKCFMRNDGEDMIILDDTCVKTTYGDILMHTAQLKDMIFDTSTSWLAVRNPITDQKYVVNKNTKIYVRDANKEMKMI